MIIIRSEILEDYEQISEVITAAFNQKDEAVLVDTLRKSPTFIPELSLVAVIDKKIVGHILFSKIKIKSEEKETTALALAPLAVRPDYQNKGIGTKLVEKGLKECKRLNHKIVNVLGHPNFYPKFGFTPASKFGIMAPFDAPDEAFLILELMPGSLNGISGTVEYPPAFNDV